MKLLALVIAVILMSVLSESIYAQDQVVEAQKIDVDGTTDPELIELRKLDILINTQNENADEKVSLLEEISEGAGELGSKQIEIFLKKQKLRAFYEARDKFILCLQNKKRDCSNFKSKYESEIPNLESLSSDSKGEQKNSFNILNPYIVNKIRQCSEVMHETFPGFMAVVEMDITIDESGKSISAYIDEDESEISHYLRMFSKCVEHFARKLHFTNETGKSVSFKKNFIFGFTVKEG